MTTDTLEADIRLPIEPHPSNGLRTRSQIMVEKIFAVRRERCGPVIGRLDRETLSRLDEILAFVIGLAD
jgi:mRNA interferase MazF